MLAGITLLALLIAAACRLLRKERPLERSDLQRLARVSEDLRREDSLPFL
jgi:hypothetical protein